VVGDFTATVPPLLQEARVIVMVIARTAPGVNFRIKLPMLRVRAPLRYVGEVRKILVAVAVALVISGCGAYAIGSNPSPTPSTGPGLNFDVVVTEKDHAATMRVGQKLEVVLHATNGMANWSPPKSTYEAILVPIVNPAATAVRGVTLAAFQAMAAGQAEITAYASPNCPSGSACPMYVAVFSVKVTVTH
jgi:hypothetical protein